MFRAQGRVPSAHGVVSRPPRPRQPSCEPQPPAPPGGPLLFIAILGLVGSFAACGAIGSLGNEGGATTTVPSSESSDSDARLADAEAKAAAEGAFPESSRAIAAALDRASSAAEASRWADAQSELKTADTLLAALVGTNVGRSDEFWGFVRTSRALHKRVAPQVASR